MAAKQNISARKREDMIAEKAYYLALSRGFEDGDPIGDWLEAEKTIDAEFTLRPHDNKLAQLYKQLAVADERVRALADKVKKEARDELHEDVARIRQLRDDFSEKLDEIRELTGEAKRNAKRQADKLWDNFVAAFKAIAG